MNFFEREPRTNEAQETESENLFGWDTLEELALDKTGLLQRPPHLHHILNMSDEEFNEWVVANPEDYERYNAMEAGYRSSVKAAIKILSTNKLARDVLRNIIDHFDQLDC